MTFLSQGDQKYTSHLFGGQTERLTGPQSNVVAPRHLW